MGNNQEIASRLRQIAVLLDEQEVAFKPAAYRKAAVFIESHEHDMSEYADIKSLKALPGIGEAIARKILEYIDTGEMAFLKQLQAEQGVLRSFDRLKTGSAQDDNRAELMDVEGLGPKHVRMLQDMLGITTVLELVNAAQAGKLRDLPRFSEDMEKKILENAGKVDERTKRFPREEVQDDVVMLLSTIEALPHVEKAGVAGSFRREKTTVGDIDILAVTTEAQDVSDAIARLPIVRDIVAHGDRKISFDLHNGLRIDVRLVKTDQWGATLLYFTGSKEHNILMRKKAIARGWKLNEYGLLDGEICLASETEEEISEMLGKQWVEPRERV